MNPKEVKKEKKKWWRYVLYFIYGWVGSFVGIVFLVEKSGNNNATPDASQIWGGYIFITILALILVPLIDLIAIKDFGIKVKAYFRRFLFPLYFFPIKIITYSIYYLILTLIKFFISILKILWDFIRFPFISLKNFLKSLFIAILVAYMLASLFVNLDYIRNNYGWYNKFFSCAFNGKVGINDKIKKSVVRVVGEDSEGSGFFVQPDEILTNFHVIANEPSPKIIFPDGSFIVPKRIIGNKDRDLAIIFTEKEYPDMVLDIYSGDDLTLYQNEAFFATGYPMGTDLLGGSTQLRGNFMDDKTVANYQFIQTNISLAQGMSGGPLTDLCGTVMGVNTMGIGGISLFVPINKDLMQSANFTDKDVEKIQVNPNGSPEDVVTSFYVYLKARKMEDAFNLLSQKYLQNTNFTEWNSRFSNVIDVDVISTSKYENTADTVFIKFMTQNWTNNEVELHYYEGAWKTISENGVNKMLQSDIQEVNNPDPSWFNPPLN
jgi:hypothetical protein